MRSLAGIVATCFVIVGNVAAQSVCDSGCNRSAALGVASSNRTAILGDSSCSLRVVLRSPLRGEEISIPSGTVERNFMGVTVTSPFHKLSDLLVLNMALQSDATFPPQFARGAKESISNLKLLEDDPAAGLRWSFVVRAVSQNPTEDRVSLRASWRAKGTSSGFSMTEVRLAPSLFTLWCR